MKTRHGAIAVFLDGTDFAEQALPSSVYVARRTGQPLWLVRVFGPEQVSDAYATEHALRYLRGLAIWARRQGVDCETSVLEGETVTALARFALCSGVRYLSVAANGPLSNEDCFSDLVSNRLLRLSPIPVLAQTPATVATHADLASASGPIVVPLDGSFLAELALPEAVYLARALGREIDLVHADVPPRTPIPCSVAVEATIARTLAESATYMETVARRIRAEGVSVRIGTGLAKPSDFIRDFTQVEDATMVVMATRGNSGLCRPFLGHVADAIVRAVAVPILLIGPTALERRRDVMSQASGTFSSEREDGRTVARISGAG